MPDYIYALRNPRDPEYVKIGRSKNPKQRTRYHSSSVPEKFEVICEYEVRDGRKVEQCLRKLFPKRKGSGVGREWFNLEDDQVMAFLDLCGERVWPPSPGTDNDSGTPESDRGGGKRRPPFRFSKLSVPEGAELRHLFDPQATCIVRTDNKVEFDGQLMTLSKAGRIVCEQQGINWTSYGGPHLWLFENEVLSRRRRRIEESG